jgi:non-ribosomal peptide synthetase component F
MTHHQTDFYIVLEDDKVPKRIVAEGGEEGELWIGGIGVAKGYLHAPELTREKFLANPFGQGFVYRTGDIVRRLEVRTLL